MPFPLPEPAQMLRRERVVDHKRERLDNLIAEIIINNQIAVRLSLDPDENNERMRKLFGIVDRLVNPVVIKIIFSDNPLLGHEVTVDPKYRLFLNTDDRITKALGDIIRFAYDGDIPGDIVDKKRTGCRNVLLATVHDAAFAEEMVANKLLKYNPVKNKTYWSFGRRLNSIRG